MLGFKTAQVSKKVQFEDDLVDGQVDGQMDDASPPKVSATACLSS